MASSVVWIDLPAIDLDRAIKFYSGIFGQPLDQMNGGGMRLGFLPMKEHPDVGGCIFETEEITRSNSGVLVYLNCGGRLDEAEAAVVPGGGSVLEPKHAIGPHGFRTVILDSEGNRVALHSH